MPAQPPSPTRARPKPAKAARRSPNQHRSRETVAVILQAAAETLRAHGPGGFNTNRIAERAGVSIGTLYGYFANKQAILIALARELLQADRDHVRRALDHTGGQDPLGAVLAALFERHATDPAYRRTVLSTYLGAGLGADDSQQIHALITELARHPNSPTAGHPIDATQLFVLAQAVLGVARAITEHTTRLPGDLARLQADTRRLVEAYLAGLASQAR